MKSFSLNEIENLKDSFRTFFHSLLNPLREILSRGTILVSTKDRGELVSTVDSCLEEWIFSFLKMHFSQYPIVSEERAHTWPPRAEDFWIVDPLDGTANLLMGLTTFGVMITLVKQNQPIFACFFLPAQEGLTRDGIYVAGKGCKAWQWRRTEWVRTSVSHNADIESSLMLSEGPTEKLLASALIHNATQRARRNRKIACSAWSFTRIAAASILPYGADFLITAENKPWDNLPGCLLVEEAGGRVTDFKGRPWSLENYSDLVFSNGLLHEQILTLAKEVESA